MGDVRDGGGGSGGGLGACDDDPAADRYVEQFFYDLEHDPHEQNNLVADPALADVRKKLAGNLLKRMKGAGEGEAAIIPVS